jgi:hypothetical protein
MHHAHSILCQWYLLLDKKRGWGVKDLIRFEGTCCKAARVDCLGSLEERRVCISIEHWHLIGTYALIELGLLEVCIAHLMHS